MWSNDKNYPWSARGFLTPQPPAWKKTPSPVLPMSERKRISPAGKGDCFHVIHKVPASDSPYGRAKHVQLIDKDPSKAISLFWAAINAGDRVDSALKDMAVVMKQLNRSDEAIEAIKSFRHLCPCDSQESLDNVLVELYKRSGRVEEEIKMLQNKLRNIDEGEFFGGKRTKIARSQGKKIQITIEQEKSRILGNLAWAYLQQHNYGIAEQHYRKALALEPDRNKQCNLAICLMHMNRINEAKSLLQDVEASSSGNEEMDESYSRSYERALEMLIQVESTSKCTAIAVKGNLESSPQTTITEKWRKDSYLDSPCVSAQKNRYASSAASRKNSEALFTQPRRCSWGFNNADQRKGGRRREDTDRNSIRKLSFEQALSSESVPLHSIQKLNEEPQALSNGNSETSSTCQVEEQVQEEGLSGVLFTQPRNSSLWLNNRDQRRGRWAEESVGISFLKLSFEKTTTSMTSHSEQNLYGSPLVSSNDESDIGLEKPPKAPNKKSWADMVEEEENEELVTRKENDDFSEEEFNDENLNSNIIYQHPDTKDHVGNITKQLESFEMKVGHHAPANTISSRRNRLQVFRDITSPRRPQC